MPQQENTTAMDKKHTTYYYREITVLISFFEIISGIISGIAEDPSTFSLSSLGVDSQGYSYVNV